MTDRSTPRPPMDAGAPHPPGASGTVDPFALALGFSCYLIWGFFPLYFRLLGPAGALEVIVHRAVWSLAACLVLLAVLRRLTTLRAVLRDRRAVTWLALAGALIVVNWTTYVYAVQSGHTVDAALGYFINPLVTVALGLVVLRERISALQKTAVGLGIVAVAVMVIGMGRLPWVSLTLAFSFGLYSLAKKNVAGSVGPLEGIAVETGAVTPVLLLYYAYLAFHDRTSFQVLAADANAGPPWVAHLALLVGAGVLTLIPLVLFARAARGLPLGIMGLLQYVTPVMQLLLGLFAFHETMEPIRWIGTSIVWVALVVLGVDGVLHMRRSRRLLRPGEAEPSTG